jgi:hypothetical protein
MAAPDFLNEAQVERFKRDGFLLINNFYDIEEDILPVCKGVYDLTRLVAADYAPHLQIPPFAFNDFDAGYRQLIAFDRRLGGVVYDAIKQLPAFIRLLADKRHEDLVARLRKSEVAGIAGGSYGIRIDNPGEAKFNTHWHNDYFAHLRSRSGLVLWASLVPLTPEMGPVILAAGSHREPDLKLRKLGGVGDISAMSYQELSSTFEIDGLDRILAKYPQAVPMAQPGDLLLIDFNTIHCSGENLSSRARWSMQMRWFSFDDESGRAIKWSGSFASGVDFRKVHPEMIINE